MNRKQFDWWVTRARWNYVLWTNKSVRGKLTLVHNQFMDWGWRKVPHEGNDRTTYIIGLFGTGRWYINDLVVKNIGRRAQYFRDGIHLHSRPTSMIYSGHATIRYESRAQSLPPVTNSLLESVRSRFADLIFIYRHPLDSLLTNWVWWRIYLRDRCMVAGISQAYASPDELCTDLEENFSEFESFAKGDPDFFKSAPGPRFLSFSEFVEETELFVHSASLALRLEDFVADPLNEFRKIAEVMSVDLDLNGQNLARPRTRPYGYLAAKEKVSAFRNFIEGLDMASKKRIEAMGYDLGR
jgi:hypothetical protein